LGRGDDRAEAITIVKKEGHDQGHDMDRMGVWKGRAWCVGVWVGGPSVLTGAFAVRGWLINLLSTGPGGINKDD
jgi:hypothetical protein